MTLTNDGKCVVFEVTESSCAYYEYSGTIGLKLYYDAAAVQQLFRAEGILKPLSSIDNYEMMECYGCTAEEFVKGCLRPVKEIPPKRHNMRENIGEENA